MSRTACIATFIACALLALSSAFYGGYRVGASLYSSGDVGAQIGALATSALAETDRARARLTEISREYLQREESIADEATIRAGSFGEAELGMILLMQSSSPVPKVHP